MTLVVADCSPIRYLVVIEAIQILPRLYDQVIIPQSVLDELTHPHAPAEVCAWASSLPRWAEVKSATWIELAGLLDAGEAEAIALAKELNAHLVLLDERSARRIAPLLRRERTDVCHWVVGHGGTCGEEGSRRFEYSGPRPRKCPATEPSDRTGAAATRCRHILHGRTPSPLDRLEYPRGSHGPLREIIFRPYRIFYDVSEGSRQVQILHVWHGARREPVF
jgi:plasmid stabilization system protein ParE